MTVSKEDVLALMDQAREYWDNKGIRPPSEEAIAVAKRLIKLPPRPGVRQGDDRGQDAAG